MSSSTFCISTTLIFAIIQLSTEEFIPQTLKQFSFSSGLISVNILLQQILCVNGVITSI